MESFTARIKNAPLNVKALFIFLGCDSISCRTNLWKKKLKVVLRWPWDAHCCRRRCCSSRPGRRRRRRHPRVQHSMADSKFKWHAASKPYPPLSFIFLKPAALSATAGRAAPSVTTDGRTTSKSATTAKKGIQENNAALDFPHTLVRLYRYTVWPEMSATFKIFLIFNF